ncbi:MAG TPA: MBOAT family O-acyltransferase [bacterium]|nr:MBOAT family O-acyltransferase [bacterium]
MVFSSPVFLYIFFPFVWLIHSVIPQKLKNGFLMLASLCFYFYGEGFFLTLMIFTISVTFFSALMIIKHRKTAFTTAFSAILINLGILAVFKYANFFISQINHVTAPFDVTIPETGLHLPVGISFFTFQAVSCIVDIYRNPKAEKPGFIDTALYISFFPQLIAGPILRYNNFIPQLKNRMVHYMSFNYGLKRFVYGLAKKVLIANTLAVPVDKIFMADPGSLDVITAWTGAFLFTLQIYFDFSGYSDMAIGLGRMFGIKIPENFNYPLISRSVTEFWRRWHISLSTWFRDYLYIPMGGSRKGVFRMYSALWTVFFVCGLWHGASWNFILFGLFHGLVMIIEKAGRLRGWNIPGFMKRPATFLAVMLIFVVFRSDSLSHFMFFIRAMFNPSGFNLPTFAIDIKMLVTAAAGALLIFPLYRIYEKKSGSSLYAKYFETVFLAVLFALSISHSSMMFADPFIYFRF